MRRVMEWKVVRWVKAVVRAFLDNHCSLHAAGLTYFSMLAIIPILCCVLVLAKFAHVDTFAREQINIQIDGFITSVEQGKAKITIEDVDANPALAEAFKKQIAAEEFARQARAFSDRLFERIGSMDIGKIGWIGLGMLLWTVISSLGHVEVSLDEIWGLEKGRPIWKKAYLYLFVALVVPVLAAFAMSMPILNVVKNVIVATVGSTWLTRWASDGLLWFIDSAAFRISISLVFASAGFGYFFWVMPYCRVRVRHAWYGGLMTAVLFGCVLKLCAVAQVGIAKSSAVYGSFAFLPIVLAWFYMSWQVVLLGACFVNAFERVCDSGTAGEVKK